MLSTCPRPIGENQSKKPRTLVWCEFTSAALLQ